MLSLLPVHAVASTGTAGKVYLSSNEGQELLSLAQPGTWVRIMHGRETLRTETGNIILQSGVLLQASVSRCRVIMRVHEG